MKNVNSILVVLSLCAIMLVSGCMTCCSIGKGRRRVERSKEEFMQRQKHGDKCYATFMKRKHAKARELRDDFEVVFRDPEYLSANPTPARVALSEHFLYYDEKVPTPEQYARLVDAIIQRTDLIRPLEKVWLSRHATLAQRTALAKKIDVLSVGAPKKMMYYDHLLFPKRYPWVLRYMLPPERMTDDDYRRVQSQVDPKGEVYAWLAAKIAEREKFREEEIARANFYQTGKRR